MKIRPIATVVVLTTLASTTAHAARGPNQQAAMEGATFAGLTVAGTIAAGPAGFILGALGGAFLADQSRQANEGKIALLHADEERARLHATLHEQQLEMEQLQAAVADTLTFQILFASGSDTLNDLDLQRVRVLADHLHRNPELTVTLAGHADPRGSDEYNNVLSQERAKAVKTALESLGVAAERIVCEGHGNRFSTAGKGDEDAYRQERRVDITVTPAEPAPSYAHF